MPVIHEGTLTASSTSFVTIYGELTNDGTYQLTINGSAMAAGDIIALQAISKASSNVAEVAGVCYDRILTNKLAFPIVFSPPIKSPFSLQFQYKKIAAAGADVVLYYNISTL